MSRGDAAYAELAVPLPVEGRFHYRIPEHLRGALEVGHRVLVPFGPRKLTAFVLGLTDDLPPDLLDRLKDIEERLDVEPLLTADVLQLARFAADYYLTPLGEVLKVALPPGLTAASRPRYLTTPEARHWLDSNSAVLPDGQRISAAERRVLEAAVSGRVVPKETSPRALAHLSLLGFLARKQSVAPRDVDGEVELIELLQDKAAAQAALARSAPRQRLFALLEGGPRPLPELKAMLGSSLRPALQALLDLGVARRRRVPRAAGGPAEEAPLVLHEAPPALTRGQEAALAQIRAQLERRGGGGFLLQGVTASGKTEVYLTAITEVRRRGEGALVLVPEIALTPQLEARFRGRFGDDVAVLHSGLTDVERRRRWHLLREGRASIALGPRSAVWAPVARLGIVVVDEEHDASFKQQSELRYSGRDLAITRAKNAGAVVVLGSATPSLETAQLADSGRLTRLRLSERVAGRPLPTVEVVDLGLEMRAQHGEPPILSRALADRLRAVTAQREQAILFLNRRGFNTVVTCEDCGVARRCTGCDVSLTHHRAGAERRPGAGDPGILVCHYCGRTEPLFARCRQCGGTAMQPFGFGTQRVVEAVKDAVPDVRVLRLDRDAVTDLGELEATLAAFRSGEADVLVGTQMVAKGHDFPNVTLVGVLLADASLCFPDFRAAERTFQLLTQVAGRAGRAERPGHVVIQAFQRNHYAITCAVSQDPDRFLAIEGASRRGAGYPPFARLGLVRVEGSDEAQVDQLAAQVAERLAALAQGAQGVRWRGPAAAPIAKIKERHRRVLMVLAPTPGRLVRVLGALRGQLPRPPEHTTLIFDVDAVDLL